MHPYQPLGLPIDDVADDVIAAVLDGGAVITAEPGAGKSTVVPLLVAQSIDGTIYLSEPRRVAARATAQRLAELSGTTVGDGVGLVMRGEHRRKTSSKIVVMTEGVLAQIIRSEPDLPGVGAVIFDEFHERSQHGDIGLAMSIESREALRPDLSLVVMSATIEAEPISALLGDAPIIAAAGRTFPVETVWSTRVPGRGWARHVAQLTATAASQVGGSVIVFVPGRREIGDVIGELNHLGLQGEGLHGGSDGPTQRRLLGPTSTQRIIVATSVAETSLTIPNIEAVVDGGLARRAAYDPRTGLGRLETGFVTRFAADQRRGRAGRLRPGVCIRAWSEEDHRHLDNAPSPEVLSGDPLELGFALARWGDPYGQSLPLLDHPPSHRLDAAYARLADLGLTTDAGVLTALGNEAATLGVHPRTAALLLRAASTTLLPAAAIAGAVLDSDQYPRSDDFEAEVKQANKTHRREADRLIRSINGARRSPSIEPSIEPPVDLANLMAEAWPDRVAIRRDETERYLLATGSEVKLRRTSPLLGSDALVVVDADADATAGFVARAVPLSRSDAIARLEPLAIERNEVGWDQQRGRVVAEQLVAYGSLVFRRRPDPSPEAGLVHAAVLDAVRRSDLELLRWSDSARETRARLQWLHEQDPTGWPDMSTESLVDRLGEWLEVGQSQNSTAINKINVASSLLGLLDWKQRDQLKQLAPTTLSTPNGQNIAVSYDSGEPVWAVRLQWLLGLDTHPTAGPKQSPITIELLSPASRPVQRTQDLPGFWRGSYQAVRSDLRGRYPKHNWPSDPLKPDER